MLELRVTNRQELGDLWLPWCVARRDRSEIIEIAREPHRRGEAMQLLVSDVDDPDVRRGLRKQVVRDDDRSSMDLIDQRAHGYAQAASAGRLVTIAMTGDAEEPAAFTTPEGLMLHEACHRACSLWASGLGWFEFRARVDPLGWPVYECPRLRDRTRAYAGG